jgi:hypothetical protein
VTCRSCSQEIDDKAIVCYRCGTPTAAGPAVFPGAPRARRGWVWLAVLAVAVLAVAAYLAFGRAS